MHYVLRYYAPDRFTYYTILRTFISMNTLTELDTPRLVLKPVTPAVIHAQFEQKKKEEIMQFFGTGEDGYAHLKHMHEKGMETHRLSLFYFLLVDKENNGVIGECGFHTWNATHRRAELFYLLKNDAVKRKGFMTEALSEVLNFGFRELQLHRVEALIANWNTPSLKLLERYGFTKEGTMREDYLVDGKNEDSDCYSLLKWEWEKRDR
ncbi:MAG: GNAT family N-acetyltransferase [Bacteroidetes bacterium]|nr:GNAT family N-acetyltransferase [Bacteroidota bacterium]